MPDRFCEDCGDEMLTRRIRCPHCGQLVCGWCYNHVHGLQIVKDSNADCTLNSEAGKTPEGRT